MVSNDLVYWFLDQKKGYSLNRMVQENKPRASLPQDCFESAESLAHWLQTRVPYTGDGPRLNWSHVLKKWIGVGLPDWYCHPEVIAHAVRYGDPNTLEIDCDDVAVLAFHALREQAKQGKVILPQIINLIAGTYRFVATPPFIEWPSHVICTFWRWDVSLNRYRLGCIDTNGLNWHNGWDDLIKWFNAAYQTSYSMVVVADPFEGV